MLSYYLNPPRFLFTIATICTLASLPTFSHATSLSKSFYYKPCPSVDSIVFNTIQKHFKADPTIAPALLRMHFHDCFVNGCDASILLNGPIAEKTAIPNLSLRGYEAIDEAKQLLEATCPGIVSCSDILALAARDSVILTGGNGWIVETGRRDGNVSLAINTINLPSPLDSVATQIAKFKVLGLNVHDLVTLVGGHTIGTAGCGTFGYRLYNYNATGRPDPSINVTFLPTLQKLCPLNGSATVRVPLDFGNEKEFDNMYFTNVVSGEGVLESDQRLWGDKTTRAVVNKYVGARGSIGLTFKIEFPKSMVKMSKIGVLTGARGEIRNVCSAVNTN